MYANEESKRRKLPHHFIDYSVSWSGYANVIVANPVIAMSRMVAQASTVESSSHMLHRGMDKSEIIGSGHLDVSWLLIQEFGTARNVMRLKNIHQSWDSGSLQKMHTTLCNPNREFYIKLRISMYY
jgi:hypothetical protein